VNQRKITIQKLAWDKAESIRSIREVVFIQEQKIPGELEWDEMDGSSWHFLARWEGMDAGCARLTPQNQLGRLAVLPRFRRKGIAAALIRSILKLAGDSEIIIHAQLHLESWYKQFGFRRTGTVFQEAGIEHISMKCNAGQEQNRDIAE
jgi:predicted GNAT family N-acyltransferase